MCFKKSKHYRVVTKLLKGCHCAVVKLSTQQDSMCHQHWIAKGYKNRIKSIQTFWSFKCPQHWLQWQAKLGSDSCPKLLKEVWVAKFQACDHHRSETCCLVSQYPPTTFLLHKIGAYNSRNISSNINTLEQTAHTISIKLQFFDICMSFATKLLRLPLPCDCPNLSNYLNGSFW